MKIAILYDSATGNTAYLAEALHKAYPDAALCTPDTCAVTDADCVLLGFWTDKGTCSDKLKAVLHELAGKQVFLFGTAGFGASDSYFSQLIDRVKAELPADCQVMGWYMCAGRMGEGVHRRYEQMCENPETREKGEMLLRNFEAAAAHPNADDASALVERCRAVLG